MVVIVQWPRGLRKDWEPKKVSIKCFYSKGDTGIRQAESEQTAIARERAERILRVCSRPLQRVSHPADLPQGS